MAYRLAVSETAKEDLRGLRAFDRERVGEQIERLRTHPLVLTRNRKQLQMDEWVLPFEHVPPLWEIRVGEFRVYYDVDQESRVVNVRAVRRKPPHRTTKESLS